MEVIAQLESLEELTLWSVTLPDLSILVPLRRLRSLVLKLGGTSNLALLPELAPLACLELWKIRGLDDLSPVAELESLQYLFLQDLTRVTSLPDMSRMVSLRGVHIQTLKGLTDLTPLLTAPALEELQIFNMTHLPAEAFAPLASHPTLRFGMVPTIDLPHPPGLFELR
jgi:internalin A